MRRKVSYNIQMIIGSFALLLFILFTIMLAGKVNTTGNLNVGLIILLIDFILIAIALPVIRMYLNFIKGDTGEVDVKFILDKLNEFHYLSDVMIEKNKGNIDLVAIGPTGVWTIEVKNQSEKVIIHDKYLNRDLNQAFAESKELETLLIQLGYAIPVSPVLVFTNKKTRMNFGLRPINGVYVIGKKWLVDLLTKHSTGYLSPQECEQVIKTLKLYTSKIN